MHNTNWNAKNNTLTTLALSCICAMTLSLAGCGGGGGGSSSAGDASISGGVTPTSSSSSYSAQLAWVSPTRNADGSCASGISTYRINYGTASRDYPYKVTINLTHDNVMCQQVDYDAQCNTMVLSCSYQVSGLSAGTWYFAMQAIDSNNIKSGYSNEVHKSM